MFYEIDFILLFFLCIKYYYELWSYIGDNLWTVFRMVREQVLQAIDLKSNNKQKKTEEWHILDRSRLWQTIKSWDKLILYRRNSLNTHTFQWWSTYISFVFIVLKLLIFWPVYLHFDRCFECWSNPKFLVYKLNLLSSIVN